MRRLWPAIGVFALVAGCGRPNPGFKLIESGGDSDSASFGSTDSGGVTSTPTTSMEVTGSEGSMGSGSATSTTTTDTGGTTAVGMHWEFPPSCDMHLVSELTAAAADTFLVNEVNSGSCSFLVPGDPNAPACQNAVFTATKALMLVYQPSNDKPLDDYASVYALRFAMPAPVYVDEMSQMQVPVLKEAILKVNVHIRLFRPDVPDPWTAAQFEIRRFTPGEHWQNDAVSDFDLCVSPASSYRCLECPDAGDDPADPCKKEWNNGMGVPPYDPNEMMLLDTVKVVDAPGGDGAELPIKTFTKEDLDWLISDGVVVVPSSLLMKNILEARALETGNEAWYPGLTVEYCQPSLVLDN